MGLSAFLRARPRAAMLLAAALFLRLLVPSGFMAANAAGGPALVPCPAVVPASVMAHHGHHHDDRVPHAEAPCPFAALAAPALPPADPLALAPSEPGFLVSPAWLPAQSLTPGAASPPPPARGPPASV